MANEVPGTKCSLSDNAWTHTILFEAWLAEHFLEHAVLAQLLLLVCTAMLYTMAWAVTKWSPLSPLDNVYITDDID